MPESVVAVNDVHVYPSARLKHIEQASTIHWTGQWHWDEESVREIAAFLEDRCTDTCQRVSITSMRGSASCWHAEHGVIHFLLPLLFLSLSSLSCCVKPSPPLNRQCYFSFKISRYRLSVFMADIIYVISSFVDVWTVFNSSFGKTLVGNAVLQL